MIDRTLGWIQNPSNTSTLHDIVSLFVPGSAFCRVYKTERILLIDALGKLHDKEVWAQYLAELESGEPIPYLHLKGSANESGPRNRALCSGIIQAAVNAQKSIASPFDPEKLIKKPYTDDWPADGFLRWAISLGFIDYDRESDSCSVSETGTKFALATTADEIKAILGDAYLRYPPACRVLSLLSKGDALTKFEIGSKLGFTSEAGFTSFPQNLLVQALDENIAQRFEILSNYEGSSDKYARMICRWLAGIGWVTSSPKEVCATVGSRSYKATLQAYSITALGLSRLKAAYGKSSVGRLPKIVYLGMLSTKGADRQYLRIRRASILRFIAKSPKKLNDIAGHLSSKGFPTSPAVIEDDINGLINTGLNITFGNGLAKLNDTVIHLDIPDLDAKESTSEVLKIKDRVRSVATSIDPKYMSLVDLAFDSKANREFEIGNLDLFTNELGFGGCHLGGSRKPDGVIYRNSDGVIIDTKAYSKGYSLPRAQIDEMERYIRENRSRSAAINPNKWWEVFPAEVSKFFFVFISSKFLGQLALRFQQMASSTGVEGGAIDVENLLYLAHGIKSGALQPEALFGMFKSDIINYTPSK